MVNFGFFKKHYIKVKWLLYGQRLQAMQATFHFNIQCDRKARLFFRFLCRLKQFKITCQDMKQFSKMRWTTVLGLSVSYSVRDVKAFFYFSCVSASYSKLIYLGAGMVVFLLPLGKAFHGQKHLLCRQMDGQITLIFDTFCLKMQWAAVMIQLWTNYYIISALVSSLVFG